MSVDVLGTVTPGRESARLSRSADPLAELADSVGPQVAALCDVGRLFYERGWSLGTSSNYSVVLSRDPLRLLITASGRDKRRLGPGDFVVVDENARPLAGASQKPSAETWLHVVCAGQPDVGAVLHTHSVWGTLLSDIHIAAGGLVIEGYEMLKGLEGVSTHDHRQRLEIFENTQDIRALAERLLDRFADDQDPLRYGFLLRRHGLYTWGRDLAEARRHVEIIEFLLEVLGRRQSLQS